MIEPGSLERIAEDYRGDGFDVLMHPSPSELPAFLADSPVEMVARRGDHLIALMANEGGGPGEETVEMEVGVGVEAAISRIEEAELLLTPRTMGAALVMAWASLEAAARALLGPGNEVFARGGTKRMISELRLRRLISDEEEAKLHRTMYLRDAVAHGVQPLDLSSYLVLDLLGIARRILRIGSPDSLRGFRGVYATTIKRRSVNLAPESKARIEHANRILLDLLGSSKDTVSIDWEVAEDARQMPVVVLRLSDPFGMVSATFGLEELADDESLASRLNRAWGDLLEIHSNTFHRRWSSDVSSYHAVGPAA